MSKVQVFIGLGSNIGDREEFMRRAIDLLRPIISDITMSSIHETPALLPEGAPEEWNIAFLNMVIGGRTSVTAPELLAEAKRIEALLGRKPRGHWGPREIDIDILDYNNEVLTTESLTLPHPQMHLRDFVMRPLAEIAPDWRHPLFRQATKIVGILNLTPDSFSDGGNWHDETSIIRHFDAMLNDGAEIIDVGAESTRHNATPLTADAEWQRLAAILPQLCQRGKVSLDSRHPENVAKAIKCGAAWINDVSGFNNPAMIAAVKDSDCKLVFMHSLSVPADPKQIMQDTDIIAALKDWAAKKIATLESHGIKRERLIFDPGIGFGKSAAQSWQIIERAEEFKAIGIPILFGHSRKSFLGGDINERDAATLEISKQLSAAGIDYLRVHNVKIHGDVGDSLSRSRERGGVRAQNQFLQQSNMNIEKTLLELSTPSLPGISLGLERMRDLLAAIGNPQHKLPPTIHIAGTNGKGSTVAFLRSCAEATGLKTHCYISPHLVKFNERIKIYGKDVSDKELYEALNKIKTMLPEYPATFFEATTAAALLLFAQHPADLLILETGMGGRLDATNVIADPLLTVITPIALDHQEYLGTSLAAIAAEKAGIIKAGRLCVVAPQSAEAMSAITSHAEASAAPLHRYGIEWNITDKTYVSATMQMPLERLSLFGNHQIMNAATAVACLDVLKNSLNIAHKDIISGLANAVHPARMQEIKLPIFAESSTGVGLGRPVPNKNFAGGKSESVDEHSLEPRPIAKSGDFAGGKIKIYLDGGHNPHAAHAIADIARTWQDRPLFMIIGMMKDKDAAAFMAPLKPYVQKIYTVTVPDEPRSATAEELAATADSVGIKAEPATDFMAAVKACPEQSRVIIAGSLYLAGKVLAEITI